MRDRTFIIVVLALAVLLGGCIIEPADSYPDEEAIGSTSEAVSANPHDSTEAEEEEGEPVDGPLNPSMRSGTTTAGPNLTGTTTHDPAKPQPDPWKSLHKP